MAIGTIHTTPTGARIYAANAGSAAPPMLRKVSVPLLDEMRVAGFPVESHPTAWPDYDAVATADFDEAFRRYSAAHDLTTTA